MPRTLLSCAMSSSIRGRPRLSRSPAEGCAMRRDGAAVDGIRPDPRVPWATGTAKGARQPNGSAEHNRERRFNPVRFKDIVLNTDPAYLVEDLIPREGLTVVWGPPKSGKSFWVYDLMMHVALGWEYRGRYV